MRHYYNKNLLCTVRTLYQIFWFLRGTCYTRLIQ